MCPVHFSLPLRDDAICGKRFVSLSHEFGMIHVCMFVCVRAPHVERISGSERRQDGFVMANISGALKSCRWISLSDTSKKIPAESRQAKGFGQHTHTHTQDLRAVTQAIGPV